MLASLETIGTGLEAVQTQMDTIANNISNVNTYGFKQSLPVFETLLYQNQVQPGASSSGSTLYPSGMDQGTGVKVAAEVPVLTQGNLTETSDQLDVAIQGNGYFQVLQPDGQIAYTRDGAFQLNQNGQIVTADGYEALPDITVPTNATSVTIGADGTISVTTPASANAVVIGQMQLANFINAQGLQPVGQNLYLATTSSGPAITGTPETNGLGSVNQGYLEDSNTDVVSSMVDLISAERAYQLGTDVAQSAGSELGYLAQMASNA